MKVNYGWARASLIGLLLCVVAVPSWGSNIPEDEYKDLIRVNQDIQPLGAHPFGENISLYNGTLSFEQTDVSLAGNGPLLQLTRSYSLEGTAGYSVRSQYAFGDWVLNLPRIETLTATGVFQQAPVSGWTVSSNGDPNDRCTDFERPPTVKAMGGDPALGDWDPALWWKGYHLIIPGQGSHDLLKNADTGTKGTYPAVTKNHWRFSCLSQLHNKGTNDDAVGEGFLAHAPDGTTYRFDELVYRFAPGLTRPLYSGGVAKAGSTPKAGFLASYKHRIGQLMGLLSGSTPAQARPAQDFLNRRTALMLVTEIKDRFGNTLTFIYDDSGRLTKITASDGRALSVQHVGDTARIDSVTLQSGSGPSRTWTYAYAGSGPNTMTLTTVKLPDSSQWHYDLAAFESASLDINLTGDHSCATLGVPADTSSTSATITHPSGLTGTFTVKPIRHGRWVDSDKQSECKGQDRRDPTTPGSYLTIPYAWYGFTVIERKVSGAGVVPAKIWHYGYQQSTQSWNNHLCTGDCEATTWTDVKRPDGSTVRRTFNNKLDVRESKLRRTEYFVGDHDSTLLRKETNTYADPTPDPVTRPWPSSAGTNPQWRINADQTTEYAPLQKRVLVQDGDTYTWQAEAFNNYAQATKTKRSNSIAGQVAIEEKTTYRNDTQHWVLGLPKQTETLNLKGQWEVVDEYDYNHTTNLLTARSHFDQNVMTYAWNSAGQLTSFTDGDQETTSLSSYKRGIPQQIKYPDNTTQSLSVDDFGQIASITDQSGATTHYQYDATGRVTRIEYPSGSQSWAPRKFSYTYVTGAERGLGANHWRRTVTTGDARHVTYFDAELRPVLSESYDAAPSGSHTTTAKAYNWRGQTMFASYPVVGNPGLPVDLGTTSCADGGSGLCKGATTHHDALGRATGVTQDSELGPLTSTTTYLSGARKLVVDPKGHHTTTTYQVFDQPSYDSVIKVQALEGIVQTITRDLYGKPRFITQSGGGKSLTKTLAYDDYQRLCRTTEPESRSTVVDYDGVNNIAWSATGQDISGDGCGRTQVAAGSKTTRSYDAMNRVLGIHYPAGTENTTYTYDSIGNVETATTGIAVWTYEHDPRNLLKSETLHIEAYNWPIEYSYNANASLGMVTYPDGKQIHYDPDALGRPTRVGSYATSVSYLPDGSIEFFVLGNGDQYLAQKNDRQLVGNLTYAHADTGVVYSQDMTYDANANLTKTQDLRVAATRTKSFTYDDLNRLTKATADDPVMWGTETYTYDALNNILSMSSDGRVRTYHYANNRLTRVSNGATTLHSFGYDPQGNTTSKDSTSLVFDMANRLKQVMGQDTYAYDASGRRVKKTPNGGTPTYYAYSSGGQLLWRYKPNTGTTGTGIDYVYLGKKLVAKLGHDVSSNVPTGPASVTAPATSFTGSVTVDWSASTYALRYQLQQQKDSGSWATVYSGEALSHAMSGLATGNYAWRVAACNGAGCSTATNGNVTVVTLPPTGKPNLTVPGGTDTNGTYTVSWSSVNGASRFTLQEKSSSGSWSTVQDTSATSAARTGKSNGTWSYRVRACNAGGCASWSAEKSVTVLHPPSTPSSITAPGTSSGTVAVHWSSASTATKYTLQHRKDSGSWSTSFTGNATSKSVQETSTGSYTYRVKACNASGCSSYKTSSAVTVTIPPSSAPSLTVPSTSSTGGYTVSWGSVSGASSYKLEQKENSGSWGTSYSGSSRSKAYSGKTNGATYGYRVRACNVGGCSAWSGTKPVHIAIPPSKPTSVYANEKILNSKRSDLIVVWHAVSGASHYDVRNQHTGLTIYSGGNTSYTAYSGKPPVPVDGHAVRACNAWACSAWVSASHRMVYPVPRVPSLSVPSSSTGNFTVSWGKATYAASYTLQQRINSGGWSTAYSGTSRSKKYTGKADGNYGYRVRACNSTGCSSWGSTKTVPVIKNHKVTGLTATKYRELVISPFSRPSAPQAAPSTARSATGTANPQMRQPPPTKTYKWYVDARWNAATGATHYDVKVHILSGSTKTYTVTTTYLVKEYGGGNVEVSARACNASSCSTWTGPVDAIRGQDR